MSDMLNADEELELKFWHLIYNDDIDGVLKFLRVYPQSATWHLTGDTCLHQFARKGNLPAIRALLDAGLQINSYAGESWKVTPLERAIHSGRVDSASVVPHI